MKIVTYEVKATVKGTGANVSLAMEDKSREEKSKSDWDPSSEADIQNKAIELARENQEAINAAKLICDDNEGQQITLMLKYLEE